MLRNLLNSGFSKPVTAQLLAASSLNVQQLRVSLLFANHESIHHLIPFSGFSDNFCS